MDTQTNIINPPAKEHWWNTMLKSWPVLAALGVTIGFLFATWNDFKNLKEDQDDIKKEVEKLQEEIKTKATQAEFKSLEERQVRQYATQKADVDKVIKEFEPVKNWVEWRKGYEQAIKDTKK